MIITAFGNVTNVRSLRAGTRCVRALGMPGFTDAGVSSAPLEGQRYRGNRGRDCMRPICNTYFMSRFGGRDGPFVRRTNVLVQSTVGARAPVR